MATITPYFETVKVSSFNFISPFLSPTSLHIQSFAEVSVNSDGVETVSFLDASDGLVNMFGEHRSISTGPTMEPIPSERPPRRGRVLFCAGGSTVQHRGAPFFPFGSPVDAGVLSNPTETGGQVPPYVASARIHYA